MTNAHREIQELLGAFALDAVTPLEQRRIERHIETCEDCAREVAMLSDAASSLALLIEPADAGDLVQRVSGRLPARPRLVRMRIAAAVAAVAVVVAGAAGGLMLRDRAEDREITQVLASATHRITLAPQAGFKGTATLHLAGDAAVLVMRDVPNAGRGRSYQLWAIAGETPASMGVVDADDDVIERFDWNGDGKTFAVTIEPEGGSPVPTSDPVLIGS
jgi:anti-sigma-K factor RskA